MTKRETPWPMPRREDCYFYHSMRYPDGETTEGSWTIPDFRNYVGRYDLSGKTVLDVGAATGYLTFNAEREGAAVTALDLPNADEVRQVPFAASLAHRDRRAWRELFNASSVVRIKNSWWYGWHKFKSNAEAFYFPLEDLMEWDRQFDVVLAGAIVEHISDPVSAIGFWAKVAKEAVIISFTNVVPTDEPLMKPMNAWDNPDNCFVWWQLSAGLYRRVFGNLGFDVTFATSHAIELGSQTPVTRPTIIATRR